jgi:hypothetical protein
MIRISKTSKLDGIRSWSLQALDTCPGSKNADGTLVDACSGCYATTGNYVFSNVKAPRLENREDWQRLEWVDDMVRTLAKDRFFRWFDSGDVYHVALAQKILEVMQRTPWVQHWLPTRMHKFPKFRAVLREMMSLDNVMVRFSSDSIRGQFTKGLHGSVIVPTPENVPAGVSLCHAYSHGGKCSGCRACWNREIPVIAYPAHGKKMHKIINIKVAA